jgi:hypothetical protein
MLLNDWIRRATSWVATVRFPAGARDFSLLHSVRTGFGEHTASSLMGTRALSLGVKLPRRLSDHSPPSSAEVKKVELYLYSLMSSWCGASLIKHRDTFTFIFANAGLVPAYIGILALWLGPNQYQRADFSCRIWYLTFNLILYNYSLTWLHAILVGRSPGTWPLRTPTLHERIILKHILN